jgi:hypothetical protein
MLFNYFYFIVFVDFGMEIIELGIEITRIKETLNKIGELPMFYTDQ